MKEDSDPNHPDVAPYPMMPLRDIVIYPFTMFPIGTRTTSYICALEEALASDQKIFVTALRDPDIDEPTLEQIYQVGTICTVLRPKISEGVIKVILSGQERAVAEQIENRNGFLTAYVRPAPSLVKEDEAAVNTLIQRATKFVEHLHQMRQHVYALDL
jgi:ATP-dependent Lon protease